MGVGTAPGRKGHFEVLDGLRGVAAVMVVAFHTFEANGGGNRFKQIINHGYLAVDFFFLLSGFVVAYAYDDRWGAMTQWEFYKRRLIRLQPMVIVGTAIGAALFYFQGSPEMKLVHGTSVWKLAAVMLVGFTMLPLRPSMDIRGWDEMHPLNGPAWSLYFEYIANVLYAIGFRKLSNKALGIFVLLAAGLLVQVAVFGGTGDVIGGWSLTVKQQHIGFGRMLYPFFAGMLLERLGKRIHVPGAFGWCSLLVVTVMVLPRFGGMQHLWVNGAYEAACILFVFPLVVATAAGAGVMQGGWLRACKGLGAISYPLYITHYPLIYVYTAYVTRTKVPRVDAIGWGVALMAAALTVAYGFLKLYDEPVRAWLGRRYLAKLEASSARA